MISPTQCRLKTEGGVIRIIMLATTRLVLLIRMLSHLFLLDNHLSGLEVAFVSWFLNFLTFWPNANLVEFSIFRIFERRFAMCAHLLTLGKNVSKVHHFGICYSFQAATVGLMALMMLGLLVCLGLCGIGPFSSWPHCSWPQTHVAPCYQPQTVVAPYW